MIESVVFKSETRKSIIFPCGIQDHKLIVDLTHFSKIDYENVEIEITFKTSIIQFRTHDYTWTDSIKGHIATEFSPKILKLENGFLVQPNINYGIWEVKKNKKNKLYWKLNPKNANPLAVYSGEAYEKKINQATPSNNLPKTLHLLFSPNNSIEFSRSIEPFTAVVCFTDHCDFDTVENVKLQREFFKNHNIKITKGFFLNHFSKRADNASIEFDKEEFQRWIDDGHELAYHSLSQSLKSEDESFKDFYSFKPPFENISTWIDHGNQPYNFSLYQKFNIKDEAFSANLKEKGILIFWSYIDSGTSSKGIINQLNPEHFTLKNFYKGSKNLKWKAKIGVMIKNIIFHYYADEKLILKYMFTAESFKEMSRKKDWRSIVNFFNNFISISWPILKVGLFWNSCKQKTYKLAKYAPLLFKHRIADNEFYVFQTLEMVDFKKSLHPENITQLINEKGIFIAHTYFSVPMEYHEGRIFKGPSTVDQEVSGNFSFLGEKIRGKEIWNPTIKELSQFLSNFEKTILDIDANGNIFVVETSFLPYRVVK